MEGGAFDSDRIGPYSRWQGNLGSRLVVVAQDFADVDTFRRVEGWPGESVATNLSLVKLVEAAGISIRPPRRGNSEDSLFFTNAVLCLKRGLMQAPISASNFRACGQRFLGPLLELIKPRAVATLGVGALDGVLRTFGLTRPGPLRNILADQITFDLPNGARVFPMFHPSRTVLNTARTLKQQMDDWRALGRWLSAE